MSKTGKRKTKNLRPNEGRRAARSRAHFTFKKAPLDETRVEFNDDEIDEALSDARDEAHLDARRATQDKYE